MWCYSNYSSVSVFYFENCFSIIWGLLSDYWTKEWYLIHEFNLPCLLMAGNDDCETVLTWSWSCSNWETCSPSCHDRLERQSLWVCFCLHSVICAIMLFVVLFLLFLDTFLLLAALLLSYTSKCMRNKTWICIRFSMFC